MGKILVYIAVAISAITAVLGFLNLGTLTETKDTLEATRVELAGEKEKLANERTAHAETKDKLATEVAEKETALSNLARAEAEVEKQKTKIADVEKQLQEQEAENNKLVAEVDAKQAEIDQLKAELPGSGDQLVDTGDDPSAKIAEQEAVITKLETELASTKAEADQLKARETERLTNQMRQGLSGQVLAVNRAWNFVVLNIGDKNGVVSNAEMLVKRGNSLIGRVKISSVEPSTSIADIDPGSVPQGLNIAPGDRVIFQSQAALN